MKKNHTTTNGAPPADDFVAYRNPDQLKAIAYRIKSGGFVPPSVLADEFGAQLTTEAVAILYRDLRMLREVRRPYGADGKPVLGYEWADKRFSKSEIKQLTIYYPWVVDLIPKVMLRYTDFEEIQVRCRYTVPILGSVPVNDGNRDPINQFERDRLGNLLVLRYHLRAMAKKALPVIGKSAALSQHIRFATIRLSNGNGNGSSKVTETQHGIVAEGKGGMGLRRSEKLGDGDEFIIRAMVPTSELAIEDFIRMLTVAGDFIGLSPARSAGFGDFQVLGIVDPTS